MLGKYPISCLGGPDDMVGSLARRSADWANGFLVVVDIDIDIGRSGLDECLRMMVRGRRAVLSMSFWSKSATYLKL